MIEDGTRRMSSKYNIMDGISVTYMNRDQLENRAHNYILSLLYIINDNDNYYQPIYNTILLILCIIFVLDRYQNSKIVVIVIKYFFPIATTLIYIYGCFYSLFLSKFI